MRLLGVLLLCSQLFSNKADLLSTDEADCNDPIIFQAMDIALRTYNAKIQDGNQFALFQITDAKATVGNDTYTVIYRVYETTCEAQGGKAWQECDYKPDAEAQTGRCTAQVYINKAEKIEEVLHQDCRITQAESPVTTMEAPCLGCAQLIPANSMDLQEILKHAIQKFNSDSQHSSLFAIKEVINATRQVVNGWTYIINYSVQETNCSRTDYSELNPDCKHLENGDSDQCNTKVLVTPQNTIDDFKQKCDVTEGNFCRDCTVPVDITSEELHEPLRQVIKKINSESIETFLFDLAQVDEAKTQEDPGIKYQLRLQMKETNCSKEHYESLSEDCKLIQNGKEYICLARIHLTQEQEADSQVACFITSVELDASEDAVNPRYVPGLSPFRMLGYENVVPVRWKPGRGHGHGPRHRPPRGHAYGHQDDCDHKGKKPKKDKKGKGKGKGKDKGKGKHDKKKCDSSEESNEHITMKPHTTILTTSVPEKPISTLPPIIEQPVVPSPTSKEPDVLTPTSEDPAVLTTTLHTVIILDEDNTDVIIPNLTEEPEGHVLDLPGAFSLDLPTAKPALCPGDPWKSIPSLNNPNIPTDSAEKKPIIEKNESVDPGPPAVPGTFSDADLLN
ncbi:kininogen-1 isoform X1 [Microcaecilia unicolor]|uniref:T-kininogen 1-like isoform X1 n=1 Tax=Microcaecilia unicolor TaxID=1415580 RepID=A0A6P7YXA9_9AMPH|nr:T-kininogen 1-like isoform X1 [Microcaecilia unicolor]